MCKTKMENVDFFHVVFNMRIVNGQEETVLKTIIFSLSTSSRKVRSSRKAQTTAEKFAFSINLAVAFSSPWAAFDRSWPATTFRLNVSCFHVANF